MMYRYTNLTPAFSGLQDNEGHDGHVVHGLLTSDKRIALALGVHRLGSGIPLPGGGMVSAGGGTRRWRYANDRAAVRDLMNMPKAMSQKFAGLNVPMGGAKTIIFGHNVPEIFESEEAMRELLRAFAQEVLLPHAPYYLCAEDVGTTPAHMRYLASLVPGGQIAGCSQETNPSPRTARGVVLSIQATIAFHCGIGVGFQLKDMSYAIQGLGSVGSAILDMLWEAGALDFTVSEKDDERGRENLAKAIAGKTGIKIVHSNDIHKASADILVPCALDGTLNAQSIQEITETNGPFMVVGCANNQLATPEDGDALHYADLIWAPDYIANAGGAAEIISELTGQDIDTMLQGIGTTLSDIYRISQDEDRPTSRVADEMVAARVAAMSLPR